MPVSVEYSLYVESFHIHERITILTINENLCFTKKEIYDMLTIVHSCLFQEHRLFKEYKFTRRTWVDIIKI